ncbi:2-C-methyl-D-erythritol 4-phosphate cytidylyltransferase [Nocardioides sp. CPCC 206347]|uniref:2-C-methyl-D-erythritol 4-phosphate cytidylyltransferase n=1 Tax=unclassified Nocardioides TaxID=2615069 RepID=UPI0036222A8D
MNPHPYDVVDIYAPVSGMVVDEGRGALPYHLIHGESLVAAAAWAAGEARVDLIDQSVPWEFVAERGEAVLLHDPLCPMTPPAFLARCADKAGVEDRIIVGVRPVTDTVKVVDDGALGETVDRDQLVAICSPVVLPASVVEDLFGEGGDLPSTDFVELVALLRERYGDERVAFVEAPPEARRVSSDEDIAVLAALTDRP